MQWNKKGIWKCRASQLEFFNEDWNTFALLIFVAEDGNC